MSEQIKLWLEAMIQNEINEVSGQLRNFKLMHLGCCADPACDETITESNIKNLLEYQEVLKELSRKIEEGKI